MSEVINPRWASASRDWVEATVDGESVIFPASPDHPLFQQLDVQKIAPPPVKPSDVRAEAARRMQVLVGARDNRRLDIIISNGLREAARLLQKEIYYQSFGQSLPPEDLRRKEELKQIDDKIEAIRAASNNLEVMDPIPIDYKDDKYWPSF